VGEGSRKQTENTPVTDGSLIMSLPIVIIKFVCCAWSFSDAVCNFHRHPKSQALNENGPTHSIGNYNKHSLIQFHHYFIEYQELNYLELHEHTEFVSGLGQGKTKCPK
jgi:hypothetical protein